MEDVKELCNTLKKFPTDEERDLIERAYTFAKDAHEGHARNSGDPYFTHVLATAKNLARFGMGAKTVAAGLLHDTVEDTAVTQEELINAFGKEIGFLVAGVTKLGHLKYKGRQRHVESLRKFFIAMAEDIRVVVIKLCDRLHNLQTLEHVRKDKQERIALESIEIYAPLAERLGMGLLKREIQDTAFPYVYPKEYDLVEELLKQKKKTTERYTEDVYKKLVSELAKHEIKILRTDYRLKGKYSLYKKLLRYDMDIDKIYDIVALRLVVPTIEDCYHVLGIIHMMWRPLPGRIKDYIANPKLNGYQSLHTTIFVGNGGIAEIQIRTLEMHEDAEYGIASHDHYKTQRYEGRKKGYTWVEELKELQKNVEDPSDFLENLKLDFFKDRIFVYTPDGEVIDLPEGASAIDFAYAVHTEIGNAATGATINGKYAALKTKLHNGDIIKIDTSEKSRPTGKWLEYAKTTLARKHIRAYLKEHNLLQRFFKL